MRKGLLYSAALLLAGFGPQALAQPPIAPGARNAADGARAESTATTPAAPPTNAAPPAGAAPATPPLTRPVTHEPCAVPCAPCPEPCGPAGRFWVSAEYLMWWARDANVPPLVTAGTPTSGGVLGLPGTRVLNGGDLGDFDRFSGGRFTVGYWLNDARTVGLEGSYFFLGSRSNNFVAGGTAASGAVVARPFFNAVSGVEDAELVAFPGRLGGTVRTSLSSELWGAEANALCNLNCRPLCCGDRCGPCYSRVDLLGGFRYLGLDEGLGIREDLAAPATLPVAGGSTFVVRGQFNTTNRFYGGQVGARWELRRGATFLTLTTKVALGATEQELDVTGSTAINPAGGVPTVAPGGLLALPSNGGHFERTRFGVVPEVGLNVGYHVRQNVRVFVGYTFIYWNDVARPGDQIDRAVNATQLPRTSFIAGGAPVAGVGPLRPARLFRDTDYWVQGVSFGLDLRY